MWYVSKNSNNIIKETDRSSSKTTTKVKPIISKSKKTSLLYDKNINQESEKKNEQKLTNLADIYKTLKTEELDFK